MPPLFTVIMPTHEHGYTLPYAVGSLQNQTCQDFELFIIGDGIDETTRAVITGLMKHDPRIRFFDFPKGERFGEIYRHQVLMEHARGELIAYHSDDDVLFPEHLEWLAEHLRDADFAHTMILDALMDGTVRTWFFQMRAVGQLDAMRRNTTGISLEGAAHTMAAYRRLPFGWRPAPKYHYSDLYMWLQWADMTWCRFASIPRISFVHFWSAPRKPWTPHERVSE